MSEARLLGLSSRHHLNTLLVELVDLGILHTREHFNSVPLPQRSELLQKTIQCKNPIPAPPAKVTQIITTNIPVTTLKRHNESGQEGSLFKKKKNHKLIEMIKLLD